jgi:hypothetical protein
VRLKIFAACTKKNTSACGIYTTQGSARDNFPPERKHANHSRPYLETFMPPASAQFPKSTTPKLFAAGRKHFPHRLPKSTKLAATGRRGRFSRPPPTMIPYLAPPLPA